MEAADLKHRPTCSIDEGRCGWTRGTQAYGTSEWNFRGVSGERERDSQSYIP